MSNVGVWYVGVTCLSFSVNSLQSHLLLFDVVVKVPGAGVNWLLQLHDDELGWSGLVGVGAVDVAAGVDGDDL